MYKRQLPHRDEFIENLKAEGVLDKIDAIIVNHGEQDHSGSLPALLKDCLLYTSTWMVSMQI